MPFIFLRLEQLGDTKDTMQTVPLEYEIGNIESNSHLTDVENQTHQEEVLCADSFISLALIG